MNTRSALVIVILMAVVTGFFCYRGFGRENHIAELPLIYRAIDSDYLPHDFYTDAASTFGPRSYYAKLVALVATEDSLPYVSFFLNMLINIAIALITFFAARLLFDDSLLAGVLAVLLVMTVSPFTLGFRPYLYSRQLLSSTLVVPFLLFAFLAALRRRPLPWALSSAAAVLIHPSFGAEGSALALLVFAAALIAKERRAAWLYIKRNALTLSLSIAIFLSAVAVQMVPYLGMARIAASRFIEIETLFRHPHHNVASVFPLAEYIKGAGFILVALLAWFWRRKREQTPAGTAFVFPLISAVVLVLCLLGFVFVEIVPLRIAAIARPFRLLFFVRWLGLIVIAGAAACLLREKWRWRLSARLKKRLFWAAAIILAGIAAIPALLYYFPVDILPRQVRGALLPFMPEIRYEDIQTPELDAARFAKDNTPEDAVFLVPPVFGKFRLAARRAMVVDWKSFPFQDLAMVEWQQRLFDCCGVPRSVGHDARAQLNRNYKKIGDTKIIALQKKYAFTHAVLYRETPTLLPIIYENRKYKIVHLNPPPGFLSRAAYQRGTAAFISAVPFFAYRR